MQAMYNIAAATNGPSAVNLRTAGNYTIIGKAGITNVPPSVISTFSDFRACPTRPLISFTYPAGDIAVSPIAGTAITGFALMLDSSGTFSTSSQVSGRVLAASYFAPTPATLTVAVLDLETAYTDASGRPNPDFVEYHAGKPRLTTKTKYHSNFF